LTGEPWIRVERDHPIPVVHVIGEFDISQAPSLRQSLMDAADNRDIGIVVDLTQTTYLDSAGVNILFELAEALKRRQLQLALVVPEGGLVERVVSLVDLGSAAHLHRRVDAAVQEIRDVAT
jgi:anti-anti-sigma factor